MKQYFSGRYMLEILLKSGAIILFLYFFLWPVEIIGNSMQNNISDGDYVFVSRAVVFTGMLNHSDIIIYKFEGTNAVKRLIALPGDYVKVSGGEVFVNGAKLDEYYLFDSNTEGSVEYYLNPGEYFLLGDNRSVSFDSRQLGPILKQDITGKVLVRFLPVWDFKFY